MANNSSVEVDQGWSNNLPSCIIYILQGSIISSGNLLIVLAIVRYQALRNTKEYITVLGLSVADAINLAAYLFAGIYRIRLLLDGTHENQKTIWECMGTAHTWLWAAGWIQSQLMLAVISLDRLLCVSFPLAYIGWTGYYARSLVGVAWLVGLITTAFVVACVYVGNGYVKATCVVTSLVRASAPHAFVLYYVHSPQVYATLSIVIYVFVAVLYKRSNVITAPSNHPNQQYELKRQRKVTVTLAICAFCTLCLFSVPNALANLVYPLGYYTVAVVCWCVATLNPFMNVFIYPLRQKEMKQALKSLVACKGMPANLTNWNLAVSSSAPAQDVHQQLAIVQPVPVESTGHKANRPHN